MKEGSQIFPMCSTSADVTSACVHNADLCTNEQTHLGTNNGKVETQAIMIMRYLFSISFTLEE